MIAPQDDFFSFNLGEGRLSVKISSDMYYASNSMQFMMKDPFVTLKGMIDNEKIKT